MLIRNPDIGLSREELLHYVVEVVMIGELAAEMRSRAKWCKEMERRAIEEGGHLIMILVF